MQTLHQASVASSSTACTLASLYQDYIVVKKINIFHVFNTSNPSGYQRLRMPQPFYGECDYSRCDRDLLLAVNQHQSFPD